ncbi:MAG: DUF5020 family protein [candidate division KSB1 bacterium]|nr:DUF5020 family protein [candidate division KSB1 bacterium]
MKKSVFLALSLMVVSGYSQMLQVHYDMGEDREYVTTTLEMFKPDALGATFWFVDMDYNSADQNKSNSLAYWEIARYFTTPFLNEKLSATIQYNDGTATWGPLHQVWLGGISYPLDLGCITLHTDLLYRHMDVSDSPDWQLTFVWFKPLLQSKVHFTGFFDLWTQDIPQENMDEKFIVMAEPQLWYVLNKTFSVGTEVEISYNYLPQYDEWKVMPTVAVKWNF